MAENSRSCCWGARDPASILDASTTVASPSVRIVISIQHLLALTRASIHRAGDGVPYLGVVFGNGAVTGELARAGHVDDGHACPGCRVGVDLGDALLGGHVLHQVRQVHEAV